MIRVRDDTVARFVSSRMIVRAVTDLPEPELADQGDRFALVQLERDAPHCLDDAAFDLELHLDIAGVDCELAAVSAKIEALGRGERVDRFSHALWSQYGSTASRNPSPRALNANTVTRTKTTGERIHG